MFRRWGLAAVGASALALLLAAPAAGEPSDAIAAPTFTQVNQVSDLAGAAQLQDTNLVNAWGLANSPTSPLWVANNGTNTSTLYRGGVAGAAVTKVGLTVTIDGGAPTGQVFNGTPDFTLPRTDGTGTVPATFMFDSEGGDITAWASAATGTVAVVKAHVDGAIFKGMAIWQTRIGNFLLATDLANGVIRVFDRNFNEVTLPEPFFNDRHLPPGYAPFDVMTVGETVYVTYAKKSSGPRHRRPVHRPRRDDQADRQPRAAERAMGHGDRAGRLGQPRRRAAGRQLRRRPDQRVQG
jgi:uncharacterized protein (TIGR03118 family)